VFALITAEIEAHGDDVYAGVFAAIGWIAAQLPVYSVNFVLATATDLWALRYPVTNELWLLPRRAGGTVGHGVHDARSDSIHVGSAALADQPSVIVASGPMDDDPGWRPLSSGELIHIDARLEHALPHRLRRAAAHPTDPCRLQPEMALSQTASKTPSRVRASSGMVGGHPVRPLG
jgi:glutamine amidotransferase